MHQGHYSSDEQDLENAMRNIMRTCATAISAFAIAIGASACSPANGPETADNAIYSSKFDDSSGGGKANVRKVVDTREADTRAANAEARARAAEAKAACERERQRASNQGAVVGGVTGAVVGSQVAGSGARTEGSVIGGVAGVLAGRQIAKKDHRC